MLDTKKMRNCAPLLPPPGDSVVIDCLDEIEKLTTRITNLERVTILILNAWDEEPSEQSAVKMAIAIEALRFSSENK